MDSINTSTGGNTMERCKSGNPLRFEFGGLLYLFEDNDLVRIVDLRQKLDRFVTVAEAAQLLGKKWDAFVKSALQTNGCYERGNFRIELWDEPTPE
jgi:hypothetical protein